jgi:hypothetical protein
VNQTTMALPVGAISVSAGDFALVGPSPGGTTLDPQASAGFAIRFSPMAAGTGTGLLEIGGLQFRLTGTGSALPLPAPVLSITLGEPQSAQQGSAAVSFAAPAPSSGSGTVTLSFAAQTTGALDPGIVFADGSQTAPFTFNQGDTAAAFSGGGSIPFQTGTTAGTLTLVAQIGGTVSRQDVVIAPALVGVGAVQGTRQASAVTVNLTGFDNTRTAGRLSFTFYDAAGNTVLPGAINADGSDAFSSYFASSGDGGQFSLSAYFPVSGDPRR